MGEHAVIARVYRYDRSKFRGVDRFDHAPLFALEDQLSAAIAAAGAGIPVGDEIAVDGTDATGRERAVGLSGGAS